MKWRARIRDVHVEVVWGQELWAKETERKKGCQSTNIWGWALSLEWAENYQKTAKINDTTVAKYLLALARDFDKQDSAK